MTVLDVGQGLAAILQTREHALVYDAGPAFGPLLDSGNRIVLPYLRATGVRRLDALIVSHAPRGATSYPHRSSGVAARSCVACGRKDSA